MGDCRMTAENVTLLPCQMTYSRRVTWYRECLPTSFVVPLVSLLPSPRSTFFFFFLMIRRPPKSTLFPYPTLFPSSAGQARYRVEPNPPLLFVFDHAAGFFDDHLRHLHVAFGRFVERRADDFRPNATCRSLPPDV